MSKKKNLFHFEHIGWYDSIDDAESDLNHLLSIPEIEVSYGSKLRDHLNELSAAKTAIKTASLPRRYGSEIETFFKDSDTLAKQFPVLSNCLGFCVKEIRGS